jgi:C1A family cysteine protease
MKRAWYGCRPDTLDIRDIPHGIRFPGVLPTSVDLREWCSEVMDQGPIGSCTAHGVTGAARYRIIKRNTTYDFAMSRLQLYYDSRANEGTVLSDAGAEIRDVIKMISKNGVGHEDLWPYDITRYVDRPPQEVYDDAIQYKALSYNRVPVGVTALKAALAAGNPVIIGVSLYDSFESDETAATGNVPMPKHGEGLVGGHCMYVVGYGQRPATFTVRNSWGTEWGDKGDCYFPEGYLGNPGYGSDYWTIDLFGSGN